MKEKSFWRKNELIEAALDEFSTHSYQNVSLNKILKNAGISKGKFYYRFKDKKALYLFLQESAYKDQLEFQDKRMKELAGDPQNLSKSSILERKSEICKLRFWDPENEVFEGFTDQCECGGFLKHVQNLNNHIDKPDSVNGGNICPRCQFKNKNDAKLCYNCGNEIIDKTSKSDKPTSRFKDILDLSAIIKGLIAHNFQVTTA